MSPLRLAPVLAVVVGGGVLLLVVQVADAVSAILARDVQRVGVLLLLIRRDAHEHRVVRLVVQVLSRTEHRAVVAGLVPRTDDVFGEIRLPVVVHDRARIRREVTVVHFANHVVPELEIRVADKCLQKKKMRMEKLVNF